MEIWRDIPSYEGLYQVSNIGNIRSCEDKRTYSKRNGIRRWEQRIIKQKLCTNKRGRTDARVSLWKDGKEKTWLVARLVGLTWCNGYEEGMTINHINGNSLDNSAENLEWMSREENIKKGFETGLYASIQKPVCLIGEDETLRFASMAEASAYIGRSHSYVSDCLKFNRNCISSDGKLFLIYKVVR